MEDVNSWENITQRVWSNLKATRDKEDQQLAADYEKDTTPLKMELVGLYSQRHKLEVELRGVKQTIQEKEEIVSSIEASMDEAREKLRVHREKEDEDRREIFGRYHRAGEGGAELPPDGRDLPVNGNGTGTSAASAAPTAGPSNPPNRTQPLTSPIDAMDVDTTEVPHRPRQKPPPLAGIMADEEGGFATVIDGDGKQIGVVKDLPIRNQWTDMLRSRPVFRPVTIRTSRKFTAEHLQSIYEPSDNKGAKWIGCMIQATGDVYQTMCEACSRGTGVFADCIMAPDTGNFPRCGSCEWARQGCHGASTIRESASEQKQRGGPREPAISTLPIASSTGGFKAVNAGSAALHTPARSASTPGKLRTSLPSEGKGIGTNKRKNSPLDGSEADTPRADDADSPAADDPNAGDLPEIKRATLSLKHDGEVYLEPELMEGVPLRKISEMDAYWDATWKPIGSNIEAQLRKWQQKLEGYQLNGNNTEKHAKFLAGRQVNRGNLIMKFLDDGEINPYQIVGKRFINTGFLNYDTIYRMVGTLDELRKFHTIDVTPIEWLRERLNEVYMENPKAFQLSKVVHNLYHDPKLQILRSKNGFGNIGRPSGYKARQAAKAAAAAAAAANASGSGTNGTTTPTGAGSATKRARSEKRKEPHNTPKGTPTKLQSSTSMSAEAGPSGHLLPGGGGGGRSLYDHGGLGSSVTTPSDEDERPQLQAPPQISSSLQYPDSLHLQQPTPAPHQQNSAENPAYQNGTAAAPAAPGSMQQQPPAAADQSSAKKLRLTPQALSEDALDLESAGYTSTDSYSRDTVMRVDWRVSQIKTRSRTSNTDITQYWHWVDPASSDDGVGDYFEHQVLREVRPPAWGVYKEPIDFHLRLTELIEIVWSSENQRIIVSTRPVPGVEYRGDILAQFKRERTKRRFLKFLKRKGVKLLKTSPGFIDDAWAEMTSEVLPVDDSDEGKSPP